MSKKAAPKKAAKKAAKKVAKKTAKKTTRKPKIEKQKAIETKVTPMTDSETVIADLQEKGITPFKDPMTRSPADLERRVISLSHGKSQAEAELAACLYAIEKRQIAVSHGWDKKDYYHEHLKISYTKATELARTWRLLIEVGVKDINLLSGLSWTKLKIIRKGISDGKITSQNIEDWLGRCIASPTAEGIYTDIPKLENMVKKMVAEEDRKTMDDSLKTVKFKISAFDMPIVLQFEDIAKTVFETEVRGDWFMQAIIDFSSNYANVKDRKDPAFWKARGLAVLKEVAERVAPVAAIFVPLTEDITSKKIGVAPTSHIYQGYKDGAQEPLFCIASSEAEAKRFLDVKQIRMFPIMVAKSLMPKAPFTVETEKPVSETPKKRGRPAKKAKAASILDRVSKITTKQANSEIKRIVHAIGVKEAAYKKQKAKFEKDLPEGLNISQAMLAWLIIAEEKEAKKK